MHRNTNLGWDFWFWWWQEWRWPSFGLLHRAVRKKFTNVSWKISAAVNRATYRTGDEGRKHFKNVGERLQDNTAKQKTGIFVRPGRLVNQPAWCRSIYNVRWRFWIWKKHAKKRSRHFVTATEFACREWGYYEKSQSGDLTSGHRLEPKFSRIWSRIFDHTTLKLSVPGF